MMNCFPLDFAVRAERDMCLVASKQTDMNETINFVWFL